MNQLSKQARSLRPMPRAPCMRQCSLYKLCVPTSSHAPWRVCAYIVSVGLTTSKRESEALLQFLPAPKLLVTLQDHGVQITDLETVVIASL